MDKKIGISVGIAIFIVIVGICFYELFLVDKEGPTIHINDVGEITYTEGDDVTPLLAGVTAVDGKDGDVSDTIIVSRITSNGCVYYAAEDKRGNVTESHNYRKINYLRKSKTVIEVETTTKEVKTEAQTTEVPQEETTVLGKPVIKLVAAETTINAGEGFTPLSFVESTFDDSGDVSRRIRIDGNYDIYTPGDYVLEYSVTDPEGNQSDIVNFTLHVKASETMAAPVVETEPQTEPITEQQPEIQTEPEQIQQPEVAADENAISQEEQPAGDVAQ